MKLKYITNPFTFEIFFHRDDLADTLDTDLYDETTLGEIRDWFVNLIRRIPEPMFNGFNTIVFEGDIINAYVMNSEMYLMADKLVELVEKKKQIMIETAVKLKLFEAFGLVSGEEFKINFELFLKKLNRMLLISVRAEKQKLLFANN